MIGRPGHNERSNCLTSAENARLQDLETRIAAGLNTFLEVGAALLEIRDSRLYREAHDSFQSYCRARWGIGRRHAYQLIDAAVVVDNVRNCARRDDQVVIPLPANEAQARPLARLAPHQQREAWFRVVDSAPNGRITAAHVSNIVRDLQNPRPGAVHYSSERHEWYTPSRVIEAVLDCLGAIDLDPCSNSHTEPAIPARKHYTAIDDGLSHEWVGRVYMNPPYGAEIGRWTTKLHTEHKVGNVSAAIALVPARTDTTWFRGLAAYPRCFVHGRLSFSGHENSAPFPSAAFYMGADTDRFVQTFQPLGDTYVRIAPQGSGLPVSQGEREHVR